MELIKIFLHFYSKNQVVWITQVFFEICEEAFELLSVYGKFKTLTSCFVP
jgi:hypothetical protein